MEKRAYLEDWFREESRFHYNSCMLLLNTVMLSKGRPYAALCSPMNHCHVSKSCH
jgi:hypothetical protein